MNRNTIDSYVQKDFQQIKKISPGKNVLNQNLKSRENKMKNLNVDTMNKLCDSLNNSRDVNYNNTTLRENSTDKENFEKMHFDAYKLERQNKVDGNIYKTPIGNCFGENIRKYYYKNN